VPLEERLVPFEGGELIGLQRMVLDNRKLQSDPRN
jgi:hypothetical protein